MSLGVVRRHSFVLSHHKAEAGFLLLHKLVVCRLPLCQLLRVILWGIDGLSRCLFQTVEILFHSILIEMNLVSR